MECIKSSSKRDVHSNKYLKKKKQTQKPLTLHIKVPEKEQQMKTKLSGRKEVTRVRVEINEAETKKTIER